MKSTFIKKTTTHYTVTILTAGLLLCLICTIESSYAQLMQDGSVSSTSSTGHSLHFWSPESSTLINQEVVFDFTEPFTVEFWIYPEHLSGRRSVFSTRNRTGRGSFQIEIDDKAITVTGVDTWIFKSESNTIRENEWNHVAYVRTGDGPGDQTMYVNGHSVDAADSSSYTIENYPMPFLLGKSTQSSFQGYLDELRIWQSERSEKEIRSSMFSPLQGNESGLIGYWPMNEGSDKPSDATGNGNQVGELIRIAWNENSHPYSNADALYSINLNGDETYAEINQRNPLDFTEFFSIEFWVNPSRIDARQVVFSTRLGGDAGGFQIEVGQGTGGTGRVSVTGVDTWILDSHEHEIPLDEWTHITYSRLGNSEEDQGFLINGSWQSESTKSSYHIHNNSSPYRIAKTTGHSFDGYISELRIWNRIFSESEIKENMHKTLKGDEDRLIGYWPMNEGSGTTFFDLTENANHGRFGTDAQWSPAQPNGDSVDLSGFSGITFAKSSSDYTNSILSEFTAFGIQIDGDGLTLSYHADQDEFKLFGNATASFDGHQVEVSLGSSSDPGLIIKDDELESLQMGITADFSLHDLSVVPDHLTLKYNSGRDEYQIFGSLSIELDEEKVSASMGSESDPGVVIEDGKIEQLNISLDSDLTVYGLEMTTDDLTLEYNRNDNEYQIYGGFSFKLEEHEVKATLGTESNPGLLIEKGSVKQVNIGITENFSLAGLEIDTDNLGMEWKKVDDEDQYHIYGSADFKVDGESMGADFGSTSKPGIVVHDGHLKKLDVAINSNLHLGNITFITKELRIDYDTDAKHIYVTGEVEIEEVFELKVDMGSGGSEGLIIDVSGSEPRFKIEDLTIEIDHADLGTIDLKKFVLKFNEHGITESDVNVVIPSGTEIGAKITFEGDPVKIESIAIDYYATQLEDAIEVYEGIQIAYLKGAVKNLGTPHKLEVEGDIDIIYGEGYTIDGISATILKTGAKATITSSELRIKASVDMGAYRTGDAPGDWHHLLGHGSILFVVYFDQAKAGADLTIEFPQDFSFIKMDGGLTLSKGNLDFLDKVTFIIPSIAGWPFKGKKLGGVDGAVRLKPHDPRGSYLAAWATVSVLGHHYTKGVVYYPYTKHAKVIGSSGISHVKHYIHQDGAKALTDVGGAANSQAVHTIEIEKPVPNYSIIEAKWHQQVDSVYATVVGPEGFYDLTRIKVKSENDINSMPDFEAEFTSDLVVNDSLATFILNTQSMIGEEGGKGSTENYPTLSPGRYQVVLSFPNQAPDSTQVIAYNNWQPPEIQLVSSGNRKNNYDIDLEYWSALPDSTMISVFVNDTTSTNSGRLIEHLYPEDFDINNNGSKSLEYTPDFVPQSDSLYFYASIDDGKNRPVITPISSPHYHQADISGKISFPPEADSLNQGRRVFIDANGNGSFDVVSTGGIEAFGITGQDGRFSIFNVENGKHELRIILPGGYRIKQTENRYGHIEVDYDGTPVDLNIEIESYMEGEE